MSLFPYLSPLHHCHAIPSNLTLVSYRIISYHNHITSYHLIEGTVEDLEALNGGEDDEDKEKEESEVAAKFMKKSKSAPKGKKTMTAPR